MKWVEVSFNAKPENAEVLAEMLSDFGHQGVSIEHQGIMPEMYDDGDVPPPETLMVRAYFPADDRAPAARETLNAELVRRGFAPPSYTLVDDQNWAEAWKAHYHTTRIGRNIVVRPVWEDYTPKPNDIVIALDPGMAFGTGTHPTTQLCLAALEDMVKPGITVLDLGCGSGILAIAAAKLGASKILAVDNDPVAVTVTTENAEASGVGDKITAQEGSLETVLHSARRFDLLVANILARIIVQMCEQGLGQVVRPGGLAVFSGIIMDQVDDVNAALERAGLTPRAVRQDGDWVAIEAVRPAED